MTSLTNRVRAGGFMESEANAYRSRNQVTIHGGHTGAVALVAGTVLGQITASKKLTISPDTGSDGSQVAIAILWDDVDPTNGDVLAAVVDDDAEVRASDLTYDSTVGTDPTKIAAKATQLRAVGIKVRS